MMDFDTIIVGAGSAGCVLAHRLSADPRRRVLLIEAGRDDRHFLVSMPKGCGAFLRNPKFTWQFPVVPHEGNAHRQEVWMRGRLLGGSSSANGMIYVRGQPQDYDGWAAAGLTDFAWTHMAEAFRRIEDHALGGDELRGSGGPQHVSPHPDAHPACDAMIEAGTQLGLPRVRDYNRPEQAGIGYVLRTIRDGRRASAATAFLAPVRSRPNLVVLTDRTVTRVLFEGHRAVGVSCVDSTGRGEPQTLRATREVIVAAGGLQSPQLLQVSGIGPAAWLRAAGIPVLADRGDVGTNLREHWMTFQQFEVKGLPSYNGEFGGLRLLGHLLRYLRSRTGLMSTSSHEITAFAAVTPGAATPDLQMIASPFSFDLEGLGATTPKFHRAPGLQMMSYPMRPQSRGTVRCCTADVRDPPAIDPQYLSAESDRRTTAAGVRFVRRLFSQPALAAHVVRELPPGSDAQSDDAILEVTRRTGQSGYHAAGTCRMGTDANAVLDPRLRVRGVEGLRVVDLSAFPTLVSGNTNGPAMAFAWRAADLILEDASR